MGSRWNSWLRKDFICCSVNASHLSGLWLRCYQTSGPRWPDHPKLHFKVSVEVRGTTDLYPGGTDLPITGRGTSEVPGEKGESNLGKGRARSWSQEQHPWKDRAGSKHNAGLGLFSGCYGRYRLLPPAFQLNRLPWAWRYMAICLSKGMLLFDHFQLRCE